MSKRENVSFFRRRYESDCDEDDLMEQSSDVSPYDSGKSDKSEEDDDEDCVPSTEDDDDDDDDVCGEDRASKLDSTLKMPSHVQPTHSANDR